MTLIRRFADVVEQACLVLAGLLLFVALCSISAGIFFRYVIGDSLSWAEELARYALIWSALVGSAVAYRRGAHIAMTMAIDLLPGLPKILLEKGVHVLVAAFSALLLVESLSLTLRNFARHQLSPALQIEIGWIYLAVPFGSFLLFLAAIEALVTRRVNNSSSAL